MSKIPIELLRIFIEFSNKSVIEFERKRTKKGTRAVGSTEIFFLFLEKISRAKERIYYTYFDFDFIEL